jgi:hypothetical protein
VVAVVPYLLDRGTWPDEVHVGYLGVSTSAIWQVITFQARRVTVQTVVLLPVVQGVYYAHMWLSQQGVAE